MNNTTSKKELSNKSIAYYNNGNDLGRFELDVPYVPTPLPVVHKILSIVDIIPSDIIYDLGCGDGRFIITAAKEFNVSGIGCDIDLQKIENCLLNAKKERVLEKVSFVHKNLFDISLVDATVVILYLLTNINVRLIPKLFSELKPDTRIISHDFSMDSWVADEHHIFEEHSIYLWIVPANFSGVWSWEIPETIVRCALKIDQHFQKANASFLSPNTHTTESISIKGNSIEIRFHTNLSGREKFYKLRGTIDENTISGVLVQNGNSIKDWHAYRQPTTKSLIH